MKFLVCGGLGFIGSAFVRNHLQSFPDDLIINIDNFSIGANQKNVESISNSTNYNFIMDSINNHENIKRIVKEVDVVVNFAAETHVDRSIENPLPFIETNVLGVYSLLEAVRHHDKLLVQISTDEVYGDAYDDEVFDELEGLRPNNPYSATKAAADHLIMSYNKTYGIKSIITRCTNNFGFFQHPEKLIPKATILALQNKKIPLHGGGTQIRNWIYVLDHVSAIESIISKGRIGEIYNISADNEISVSNIVEKILKILDKPLDFIEVVNDRPGQDKKYSLNSDKLRNETNWKPKAIFDNALHDTVMWYKENEGWWSPLINAKILHQQPWTIGWQIK